MHLGTNQASIIVGARVPLCSIFSNEITSKFFVFGQKFSKKFTYIDRHLKIGDNYCSDRQAETDIINRGPYCRFTLSYWL